MGSINRRDFLKGAVVAGGSVAAIGIAGCSPSPSNKESQAQPTNENAAMEGWSFEVAPEPVADDQIAETFETEVVVVGAGTAGLVAANAAVDNGAKVILFSASSAPCSRGGSNNAIYSKAMEAAGLPKVDPWYIQKEIFSNYTAVDQKKWYRYYNNSEEATNWMIDIMEGSGFVTALEQPNFLKSDNMYGQAVCSHSWVPSMDSDKVSGNQADLVSTLDARLAEKGVQVDYGMAGYQLIREDDNTGRVTAVIARRLSDNAYVKYVGSKGVIMAAGDFSTDREMMQKYCPEYAGYVTDEDYEAEVDYDKQAYTGGLFPGDMHKAGLWIGAAWQKTMPNCPMCGNISPGPTVSRYQNFFGLLVDRNGERFMNEYASRALGPILQGMQAGGTTYALWDADWVDHFDWYIERHSWQAREDFKSTKEEVLAAWNKNVDEGKYYRADTLEELIKVAELPEDTIETIQKYNEYCAGGADPEFYKDPEFLIPLQTPPFYCEKRDNSQARFYTILGGLRTNHLMQVCDAEDNPIPGLYNVGTMVGDLFAGKYTFIMQGANYGMACLTFGYLTGKYVAENE